MATYLLPLKWFIEDYIPPNIHMTNKQSIIKKI